MYIFLIEYLFDISICSVSASFISMSSFKHVIHFFQHKVLRMCLYVTFLFFVLIKIGIYSSTKFISWFLPYFLLFYICRKVFTSILCKPLLSFFVIFIIHFCLFFIFTKMIPILCILSYCFFVLFLIFVSGRFDSCNMIH